MDVLQGLFADAGLKLQRPPAAFGGVFLLGTFVRSKLGERTKLPETIKPPRMRGWVPCSSWIVQ